MLCYLSKLCLYWYILMPEDVTSLLKVDSWVFLSQISDKTCTCKKGYDVQNGDECVLKLYPLCTDGTWRNQEGICWTEEQWNDYCNNTVNTQLWKWIIITKTFLPLFQILDPLIRSILIMQRSGRNLWFCALQTCTWKRQRRLILIWVYSLVL